MQTNSKLFNAKKVDLCWYLSQQGFTPTKETDRRAYYCSPFREEKVASFVVDKTKNTFCDWGGDNLYGDIIDFVSHHEGCTTGEAIDIILGRDSLHNFNKPERHQIISQPAVEIKKIHDHITFDYLTTYLEERCIDYELADKYLVQMEYSFSNSPWSIHYGLGFENDKGGYEIRSRHWKGGNSPKTVTTIKGNSALKVNLFEGFFDFLSALIYYGATELKYDSVVLNSLSFVPFISDYLIGIDEVNCFLDADAAGDDKMDYMHSVGVNVNDRRDVYGGFSDFNEFLINSK